MSVLEQAKKIKEKELEEKLKKLEESKRENEYRDKQYSDMMVKANKVLAEFNNINGIVSDGNVLYDSQNKPLIRITVEWRTSQNLNSEKYEEFSDYCYTIEKGNQWGFFEVYMTGIGRDYLEQYVAEIMAKHI